MAANDVQMRTPANDVTDWRADVFHMVNRQHTRRNIIVGMILCRHVSLLKGSASSFQLSVCIVDVCNMGLPLLW